MPSTSGRAATYPKRSDKLKFFHELKDLRDRLRSEKQQVEESTTKENWQNLFLHTLMKSWSYDTTCCMFVASCLCVHALIS